MTAQKRLYSRIYHDLVDDPMFADVYPNDTAFATWCRLLMLAEQAWPSSAALPHGISKPGLRKLTESGLIVVTGFRFRVRGLDKERQARSDRGRAGASGRWPDADAVASETHPDSNATSMQTHPVSIPDANAAGMPSREEKSKAREEQSKGEKPRIGLTAVIDWLESTEGANRPFGYTGGSTVLNTLQADVRDKGDQAVLAALIQAKLDGAGDIATMVFTAHKALYPMPSSKVIPLRRSDANPEDVARAFES